MLHRDIENPDYWIYEQSASKVRTAYPFGVGLGYTRVLQVQRDDIQQLLLHLHYGAHRGRGERC